MKTLKLILVAVLVSYTLASIAGASEPLGLKVDPKKQVVNISLTVAMQNPGLVAQMFQQLDESMLINNQLVYTFFVSYGKTVYRISGTYGQWMLFFAHISATPKESPPKLGLSSGS